MKKRLKKMAAVMVISFLALGGIAVQSTTIAFADTTSQTPAATQPATPPAQQTPPSGISSISPNFTTGDTGLGTQQSLAKLLSDKSKLILAMISGLVTVILVAVLIMKATALSTASAHKRAEAQQGLLWWAVGAFITFSATVICGALYAFAG